jgi:hypothetical protein
MSNVEFALQVLKNMGHDTACGACMALAFTGTSTGLHTCKKAKYLTVTGPSGEMLSIDHIITALETNREEFEGAADHLFFLQAVIATNLKDIGMPKEAYLEGCTKAWDTDDELQDNETIPRNKH